MQRFFKIILKDHREEMYLLGVLCLLTAVVALPPPTQLHTNLPASSPLPELTSEQKDKNSDDQDAINPISEATVDLPDFGGNIKHDDKPEESKNPSETAEKPKAEKDENNNKPDDVINVIQNESKESKESKDSKEKSKESKESQKPWESEEHELPKESKEEKKDSKSEESKDADVGEEPIIVQVVKRPSLSSFLSYLLPHFQMPHIPWPSFLHSPFRNSDHDQQDQPIYIVRESDFDFD